MTDRVLLVEGNDDCHVMRNLFEVRGIPDVFVVRIPGLDAREQDKGGVETLLDSLPIRLRAAGLRRLAVVVDADANPAGRWQSIRDRLTHAGVDNVPDSYTTGGTVAELLIPPEPRKRLRFGVWIMPDNHSPGMLEDFVAGMIHDGDEMLSRVDAFLEGIPRAERRFSDAHQPKARVHCWLGVSERPGRPMGQAIKADSYLDANHPSVEPFLNWIGRALVD